MVKTRPVSTVIILDNSEPYKLVWWMGFIKQPIRPQSFPDYVWLTATGEVCCLFLQMAILWFLVGDWLKELDPRSKHRAAAAQLVEWSLIDAMVGR